MLLFSRRRFLTAASFLFTSSVRTIAGDGAGETLAPVVGSTVYSLAGRGPLSLFLKSIAPASAAEGVLAAEVVTAGGSERHRVVAADHKLELDPEKLGQTFNLAFQIASSPSDVPRRFEKAFRHAHAPKGRNSRITVLLCGDSITNRGLGAAVRHILEQSDYKPDFVGTMLGGRLRSSRGPGVMGEGREGWAVADFVHSVIDKDVTSILDDEAGSVAAYTRLPKAQQLRINPFLRKARLDDDPSMVRNGYVFDLGAYLHRFALPVPDVIILGLGSNDVSESRQSAPGFVKDGLRIMHRAIREAAPKAKIGLWLPSVADTDAMRGRWRLHQPVVQAIIALQRELNDPLVDVIPVWSHMDRDTGWLPDAVQPSGAGNLQSGSVKDPIHPGPIGIAQVAEPIAAFIAVAGSTRA